MPFIGERIDDNTTPRAYQHPGTGAWWADGRPIDSGTAMLLDSEVSHYCDEGSLRPLVTDTGFGGVKVQNLHGYTGLVDAAPVSTSGWGVISALNIAWDGSTSRMYGPFYAIDDRQLASIAGSTIRNVVWQIDVTGGAANSLVLYVALTTGPSAPTLADPFLAHQCTTGRQTVPLTIPINQPWGARRAQRSRVDGGAGSTQSSVLPMYLRFGWFSQNAGDSVWSINAYETH